MKNIYLLVSVDTECDKGAKWKVKQPLTFENIYNGVNQKLQPLFDKYKIKATYLLSPEIMMDHKSVELFKSFDKNVELGTHLHSEFVEPQSNFNCSNTSSYQSDFNKNVEKAKLENLTSSFFEKFGYQPTSFRAGRFGIGKDSLSILQDLGYIVDSSVTPDTQWRNQVSGNQVNFFGAPYQPYFPSSDDFRKPGDMSILEIPVSLINKRIMKLPNHYKRLIKKEKSYQHLLFNYLTNFSKPEWLRPTFADLETMQDVTKSLININKNDDVFLCMMFHSNEFELGMSPYSLTQDRMDSIFSRLENYLEWLMDNYNAKGIGLSEVRNLVGEIKTL